MRWREAKRAIATARGETRTERGLGETLWTCYRKGEPPRKYLTWRQAQRVESAWRVQRALTLLGVPHETAISHAKTTRGAVDQRVRCALKELDMLDGSR